jgi:hypothetical protein
MAWNLYGPWILGTNLNIPLFSTVSGIFAIADTLDLHMGIVFDTFH